jgi:hypothetical protein
MRDDGWNGDTASSAVCAIEKSYEVQLNENEPVWTLVTITYLPTMYSDLLSYIYSALVWYLYIR